MAKRQWKRLTAQKIRELRSFARTEKGTILDEAAYMPSALAVLRTFFLEPDVDAELARIASKAKMKVGTVVRFLLKKAFPNEK